MSAKAKKKSKTRILLLPGATGWEAWTGSNGGSLDLAVRSEEIRPLDMNGIPSGELSMAFPVRDVSSLPFRAPTQDDSLISDMAEMHIERLGMRPEVDFGVLSDCFKVGSRGEDSLLQPVVLAPPLEGDLPKRSPQAFDVSARCLPLPENGVVLWRELGRWVFALAEAGQPLHFQALASARLGEAAGREIRLSLAQMEMQGLLESQPGSCFVWVEEGEEAPAPEEIEHLAQGYGGQAAVVAKPAPMIPPHPSQLLPADVRAERVAQRKKQQTTILVTLIAAAYLGTIGWLAWMLLDARKDVASAQKGYDLVAPEQERIDQHLAKWDELEPVVDPQHWPIQLLFEVAEARPPESEGFRLERIEIFNQLNVVDGKRELVRNIKVQGKADLVTQANTFNFNLKQSDDYFWVTQPPTEDPKTGRWGFIFEGRYDPEAAAAQTQ